MTKTTGKDIVEVSPFYATIIAMITASLFLWASVTKGIPTSLVQLNGAAFIALSISKNCQRTIKNMTNSNSFATVHSPFQQTYFHGTRADLKLGDLIEIGFNSNFGERNAKYIYLTATLDPAVWGAELALGEGRERIYLVEPTGPIEDDPNLTDKKFPGNPTKSYRSKHPFKVVGEITIWQGHPPEQVKAMKDRLAELKEQGIEAIED